MVSLDDIDLVVEEVLQTIDVSLPPVLYHYIVILHGTL